MEGKDSDGNETRRYLLFYRWIQWSFLILAAVYYIPRKVSKNLENPKCKKIIEELASNSFRYDNAEQVLMDKVMMYMTTNIHTHNILYFKFFFLNVLALTIDIATMHYFDFLLQGRFLRYGIDAYPYERDPEGFTDYMSQMFPPFAMCNIDDKKKLVGQRSEKLGCHLTIMELYEKVFLLVWIWLILLIIVTTLYIVFLILVLIPKVREFWLRTSKPLMAPEKANMLIKRANENLKIGDVYLLYRFKGHLSHARFYELLMRMADPKFKKSVAIPTELTNADGKVPITKQITQNSQKLSYQAHPDARNRKPHSQSITPPINPDYISQMYASPENLARHGQINDAAQRAPLLNKNNTSILIE